MKRILLVVASLVLFMISNVFALKLPAVPKERCVEVYGEITQESTEIVVGRLIELDRTDGDIRIYLNSPGGYVSWGVPIIEVAQALRNDLQVVGLFHASSMALPILAVGTKGKRVITKLMIAYIHRVYIESPTPSRGWPGMFPEEGEEWDQDEWERKRRIAELLRNTQIYLDETLYRHSKITHKEIAEWDDTWIQAGTILKYELADGFYEGELKPEEEVPIFWR